MQNDPTYEIRNAIYTALNGNITYNSKKYPVHMYEQLQNEDYFAIIRYPALNENSETKGVKYLMIGTIDIEVVNMRYMQKHSNEPEMIDIVNDINTLIVHQNLSMTGFEFSVQPYVIAYSTTETLQPDQRSEIRKIITYQFIIQQS